MLKPRMEDFAPTSSILEKLSKLGNKRNVSWVRVTWDACSKLVVLCHTKQGHMMTS